MDDNEVIHTLTKTAYAHLDGVKYNPIHYPGSSNRLPPWGHTIRETQRTHYTHTMSYHDRNKGCS